MIFADLQYFPPVTFFSASFKETNIVFPLYDGYRKMGFANRCFIAGANNLVGLSIPLEGGRQQKASMGEIRVSRTEDWQKQHWRSLHSAYSRSPYFDHYAGELERLFQSRPVLLSDWNLVCLKWIREKTDWPPAIHAVASEAETETWKERKPTDGSPAFADRRNTLTPRNYHSFAAPRYQQVFEETRGFQANLSVLDLLFNTGPQSTTYLREAAGLR